MIVVAQRRAASGAVMFLSCGDCAVYGHAKVGGCGGSELLAWRVVVLSSGCLSTPLALCLGLGLLLCAGTWIGLLVMTRSGVMRGRVVLVSLLRGFPVRSLQCCWRLSLLLQQRCGVVVVVAIKLFSWLCCAQLWSMRRAAGHGQSVAWREKGGGGG
jgi:hypothetical protein